MLFRRVAASFNKLVQQTTNAEFELLNSVEVWGQIFRLE
jgi:hypothetical protein